MFNNLRAFAVSRRILFNLRIRQFQQFSLNDETEKSTKNLDYLIQKYEDKLLFNSYLMSKGLKLGYKRNSSGTADLEKLQKKQISELKHIEPLPIYLKYLHKESQSTKECGEQGQPVASEDSNIIHFPYSNIDTDISPSNIHEEIHLEETSSAASEIKERQKLLKEQYKRNWMTAYESYTDDFNEEGISDVQINYGTPDPNSKMSNIPCGGCGALLHCKDTAIPGYIPSEIFKNFRMDSVNIQGTICQRCYFLKEFNTALQVRVSAEHYPKVLETIKRKSALVLLLIDLLDFPCSLWPGITEIIGNRKPVIVVGNKVDLLPSDSRGYLERIKSVLTETVTEKGLEKVNIAHVSLISALTGWGVEELVTKIHNVWGFRGDVYLVGCTNVGKSSLFNALLQSDLCKVKASDLIQRATTSCWPGTTLNLLKFPILRPSGWHLFVRTKRLQSARKVAALESKLRQAQLRETQDSKYATLIGHIDKTFTIQEPSDKDTDIFSIRKSTYSSRERIGVNEKDPEYALSKWCYDTPGVVQPDQIIHLLTTEELTKTLPKELIKPQSYRIKLNHSIFIGGLARLDYLEGPTSVIITVFRSKFLPLTVCDCAYSDELYEAFLGTKLFSVPEGNAERLAQWPSLSPSEPLNLDGVSWEVSCGDIVLSSAGWVSITCGSKDKLKFRAWTPEARGIFIRKSILPFAVSLKGAKIRNSVAYRSHKLFVK